VDIAHAYPQEANVKSWIRNYTLHRKKDFTITDKWKLSACNEPSVLNLMTCCEVEIDRNKNIILTGEAGRFKVEYDKKLLSPATDTVELTDPKLIHSWNRKKLTRIRFTIVSQQISGESKLVIKAYIYLGHDNHSDYNVLRGSHYTFNITVYGINDIKIYFLS
jgi:archaellum biogenesis ATPase FlaH